MEKHGLWDGTNVSSVASTSITNIDKLAPTSTAPTVTTKTSSITITLKQVDQNAANGSGKSDINTSLTRYRLVTDTKGTTAASGKDWQTSNVISGLTQNTTYYVQTRVTDKAGNTTNSAVTTAKTATIPTPTKGTNLTFTATPSSWTNGNVSVKVTTTITGYTLQTSKDGKTWGTTNPLTYTANGTAYARLWDGTNASSVASTSITNIDKIAPTNTAPTATSTTNTITITNKQTDSGGSGIKTIQYSKDSGNTWQTNNTFTGLTPNTSYKIVTKTTDNAGNVTTSGTTNISTKRIRAEQVEFKPENSNWKVTNVKEALDYLYNH